MSPPHLGEEICLDYLTGELPAEAKVSFDRHLDQCPECRLRAEQYRVILRDSLPSIADEVANDMSVGPMPWSAEDGEKRLYAAIEHETGDRAGHLRTRAPLGSIRSKSRWVWAGSNLFPPRARTALVLAVSIIVAFGLANSVYHLGVKHGLAQSRAVQAPPTGEAALRAQLDKLVRERDAIQAGLLERGRVIAQLKSRIEQQQKQGELMEAKLQSTNQQAQEQAHQIFSQRDELARRLEDQQAILAATQKKLETVQQAGSSDALRVASVETRIQQMSQLIKDKDATIEERERMLASDRDIRELMGARDLYIAEVYDVGGNGKKKKPYGRVFYTKGKSLIFYGYDLDQQPGLKNANTFQAWGMRGPDRNSALNLGVMYVDNSTNKRWVLRFDDPKALEEINAVFVTVEPDGESRVPRGKQVLFAYLKVEPNHP